MSELARLAAAVADPSSISRVKAALATRLWGLDPQRIQEIGNGESDWQDVVELLAEHRDTWVEHGFMRMIGSLSARLTIRPRLAAYEDGDRRLTNFRHAAEILHQAELEHHLSPDGLLRWREREKQRTHGRNDAAELRIEREVQSVEIATLHSSKGLQYEIVFCPFLWSAKALEPGKPALRHVGLDRVEMDCAPDKGGDFLAAADNERLGQDVRLAYVALTRARRRCYVGFGRIGRAAGTGALVHLLEIDGAGDVSVFEIGVRRLAEAHPDTMSVRDLSAPTGPPQRAAAVGTPPTLAARSFAASCRERLRPWQVVSFSALARGSAAEIPDHLDPVSPSARIVTTANHSDPVAAGHGMFAFARGARAGTCLHEILEHVDLAEVSRPATKTIVTRHLERHGLAAPGRHRATGAVYDPAAEVETMLGHLARAEVPGEGFRLADARTVSNEWQFYIPMAELGPSRLAELFAAHGEGGIAGRYAPALERLESTHVRGFLVGFVDTVLSQGNRWYVVDWKSNYLGDLFEDYAAAELDRTMTEADYVLQYHLYVLGLHRYLRSRLPDYDYDENFGGALYVFLRGIHDSGATGWFHDRPSRALIDALDTFFETGEVKT